MTDTEVCEGNVFTARAAFKFLNKCNKRMAKDLSQIVIKEKVSQLFQQSI
jgi:hypothetical protein